MKVSPVTSQQNYNTFKAVNKKYYDKTLYGIKNYCTFEVLTNVECDVQHRKISAQDAIDTLSLIKRHIDETNIWIIDSVTKNLESFKGQGF